MLAHENAVWWFGQNESLFGLKIVRIPHSLLPMHAKSSTEAYHLLTFERYAATISSIY
jgi:hypothetical protein